MKRIISGIMIICILFCSVDVSAFASSTFQFDGTYEYYDGMSTAGLYASLTEAFEKNWYSTADKNMFTLTSKVYSLCKSYGVENLTSYYDSITPLGLADIAMSKAIARAYKQRKYYSGTYCTAVRVFFDKVFNCNFDSGSWNERSQKAVQLFIIMYYFGIDCNSAGITYSPTGESFFERIDKIKQFLCGRYSTMSSFNDVVNYFYDNNVESSDGNTVTVSNVVSQDVYDFCRQQSGYTLYSTWSPKGFKDYIARNANTSGRITAASTIKNIIDGFINDYGSDVLCKVFIDQIEGGSSAPYNSATGEKLEAWGSYVSVICCKKSKYLIEASSDGSPNYTYDEKFVLLSTSSNRTGYRDLDSFFDWKTFYVTENGVYTDIFIYDQNGNTHVPFKSGSNWYGKNSSCYPQCSFSPRSFLYDNNLNSMFYYSDSLYISSDGRSLPMFFSFDALKNYSLNTLLYYVPSEWSNKGTVSTVNYNTSNNYVYNYISNYIQENPGIDLAELQALIDSLAGHLDNLADTIEKQVDVEKSNNKILKQIRDLLKTIAVLLGVSAADPDPGEEDPDDDDTTSIATFILIFLIFVCLLSLLLKCVGLMFKVMVYITTIFGIPATQGTLPDSFVYGLRVFKGEVPIGGALSSVSNEYAASPLVMELGGVHISFYMLFVILFEIAFIGLTIKAVRKFAEKINFPKM